VGLGKFAPTGTKITFRSLEGSQESLSGGTVNIASSARMSAWRINVQLHAATYLVDKAPSCVGLDIVVNDSDMCAHTKERFDHSTNP
jgi:hypothetical protein